MTWLGKYPVFVTALVALGLAVLADALEEAGCDSADILNHLHIQHHDG